MVRWLEHRQHDDWEYRKGHLGSWWRLYGMTFTVGVVIVLALAAGIYRSLCGMA